jgi:hypothetical protein
MLVPRDLIIWMFTEHDVVIENFTSVNRRVDFHFNGLKYKRHDFSLLSITDLCVITFTFSFI